MRVPSAAQLLETWEGALSQPAAQRALSLLAAAEPELAHEALAALPLGRRDARLLRLRECLFGGQLQLVVPCPHCAQLIESQLGTAGLVFDGEPAFAETYSVQLQGYTLDFRPPASTDLIALAGEMDAGRAREHLLTRCVLDARDPSGAAIPVRALPQRVLAELSAHMESADPGAVIELNFECPACHYSWPEVFDIAGFLWHEIHAWAQRILRDVHVLARAYGWREADVLALSPTRRQVYLELCRP